MKRIFRLLVIVLVICSLSGLTSCVVFEETSHAQKMKPFKHPKPLPKKWVLDNGKKEIVK